MLFMHCVEWVPCAFGCLLSAVHKLWFHALVAKEQQTNICTKIADKLFSTRYYSVRIVGPLDNVTLGSLRIQYPAFARSCHQSCCVRFVTEKLFSNSFLSSIRFPLEMECFCRSLTAIESPWPTLNAINSTWADCSIFSLRAFLFSGKHSQRFSTKFEHSSRVWVSSQRNHYNAIRHSVAVIATSE